MKKVLVGLALLASGLVWGQNAKLSDLPAASALGGTELLYGAQSSASVKITANQVKTFTNVPAGSSGNLQYNSSSAFAGMGGTAWDDTNRSLAITGATVTASKPVFDLTQTWNSAGVTFTFLKGYVTSTASATGSMLLDLGVGASSIFSVSKVGKVLIPEGGNNTNVGLFGGTATTTGISIEDGGGNPAIRIFTGNNQRMLINSSGPSATILRLGLAGDASNPSAGLYNTSSKVIEVNAATAGSYTGTALLLGPQTVAQLPSCAAGTKGARATVTDATSTTFLATLTGSGANIVPAFCNGTNWLIG